MRLWASETIGAFGRQVTGLALPTVAILLLKVGPFEMGVLNGLQVLAFPILGLIVGVWADRWHRRPIMVVANLGRMIALGSIPVTFVFGILHLYQLYIVATVVGIFTVFFDVAYQSYLPSLIERADLVEGNSKLETSQSAAQVVGPALAGFLIQVVGAAEAIAADALAFLTSAVFIFSIKKPEPKPQPSGEDPNFIAELKEGAQIVIKNPILRELWPAPPHSILEVAYSSLSFSSTCMIGCSFHPGLLGSSLQLEASESWSERSLQQESQARLG